ncbi:dTDP-4-dehydrorhamnose 3,5-epimerase [Leptolyngbya valderiana BDU 20041]|nr:dTDP-4-dehydrorhamnose 3,5-epimerase [Leptolyngbya valderiana BDU 20041]
MSDPRVKVRPLSIPDVKLVRPRKFEDRRGFFSETWNQRDLAAAGIDFQPVQDNHSLSVDPGVVRGLHFQIPPFAQAKLVRVLKGRLFDVALDLRRDSPTFGEYAAVELDAASWWQLWVPAGFAHGFVTLEPDTEVFYKVDAFYAPEHDRGIFWADPDLGIDWPLDTSAAVLSDKDKAQPRWAEVRDSLPF